jgi:tRNA threonylcarbamoyladenosine biosynthesis protein TsaB
MALILHLETATTTCSVALSFEGKVLHSKSLDGAYVHAEELLPLVQHVLEKSGQKVANLQAVSYSKGPGSYTGLRIGLSTAKGLCMALNIPLLGLDTLFLLALQAHTLLGERVLERSWVPMLDARRMEVYRSILSPELLEANEPEAWIASAEPAGSGGAWYFGDGAEKCQNLLTPELGWHYLPGVLCRAEAQAEPAWQQFQKGRWCNLESETPFYLKSFIPGKPKTNAI